MKYESDKYLVKCDNKVIAQLYVGGDLKGNNELRIKQGMPRSETIEKIIEDCPDFSKKYGLTKEYYPKFF